MIRKLFLTQDRLILSLTALALARTVVNMTRRFAYPFLPAIARGLGVSLEQVQTVMAVNSGVGIASPLFGPLSDRYGRKRVLMGALAILSATAVAGALVPRFAVFALVMIGFGVVKMIYDPAMFAYIGDRVPYARRGMAIGATELSWAGALIIIAPLAGFLLDRSGLQAVFAALAVFGALVFVLVWRVLPSDHPRGNTLTRPVSPLAAWSLLRRHPAALGGLGYCLFLGGANEIFFINYGAWIESSFDLVLAAVGIVSTVIAAAEVTGEFAVMGLADRLGKRRLALTCATVTSASYVVLPHLSFSLPVTLIGLFILFVAFETAIVGSMPLFTELLPEARSTMMSGVIAALSIGRLTGAVAGGALYTTGNFALVGAVAMIAGLLSVALLWRGVSENSMTNP